MTHLLLAHHLLSAALVIVCWWMSHEYARDRPPGRFIALGWSLVGLFVLGTAFVRHHTPGYGLDGISWGVLLIKASLLFTLICVIVRFVRRRRREARYGLPHREGHPG